MLRDKLSRQLRIFIARARREDCGSTLLEFALSASILLIAIFGILEFSLALYVNNFVQNAAVEGARYAIVRGSSWTGGACATYSSFSCTASSANVTSYIQSSPPPGISPTAISVTTTWPGTQLDGEACDNVDGDNSPTCVVEVQVSYSFNFLIPFLPQNTISLTGQSTQAIMQ